MWRPVFVCAFMRTCAHSYDFALNSRFAKKWQKLWQWKENRTFTCGRDSTFVFHRNSWAFEPNQTSWQNGQFTFKSYIQIHNLLTDSLHEKGHITIWIRSVARTCIGNWGLPVTTMFHWRAPSRGQAPEETVEIGKWLLCLPFTSGWQDSWKRKLSLLCRQEDDFKLKVKAHSSHSNRKVNGVRAGHKPLGRLMDNELPIKSLPQADSSGRYAIKVKELTAQNQHLRQSVQEKELAIRKNEISSNFKVSSGLKCRDPFHSLN